MELFINKEKRPFINIDIYSCKYKIDNQEQILFFQKKESANDLIRDRLTKISAKFMAPTFQEHIAIIKKSVFSTADGTVSSHDSSYQENVIKYLLKKVITDDYELEITESNFGQLHPLLASCLYQAFNDAYLSPKIPIEKIYK